jgi:glycosyltransferase involved in cell wall biosynthesis
MTSEYSEPVAQPTALLLTPEAPFPTVGGGPLRTASILRYLEQRYDLHVISFREPGAARPDNDYIELPHHSKSTLARASRNLQRAFRGVPPLVDRFAGFEDHLTKLLRPCYDVVVIEHFWAASYASTLRPRAKRLVLDLHNIESSLLERTAATHSGLLKAMFHRWASCCRALERELLPVFDAVLTASDKDAAQLPPGGPPAWVVPNTVPLVPRPEPKEKRPDELVFSGNMEYAPNTDAVSWFVREIWPLLRQARPQVTARFLGKNDHAIRHLLDGQQGLTATGPVPDAIAALAESSAAIVPLRSGSGTRVKIIEAWAAALPVLSTSLGAEGLPGRPGEHMLVADTPAEFVDSIVKLLQNPGEAHRLAEAGRRLYEQELTWQSAWNTLTHTGL